MEHHRTLEIFLLSYLSPHALGETYPSPHHWLVSSLLSLSLTLILRLGQQLVLSIGNLNFPRSSILIQRYDTFVFLL